MAHVPAHDIGARRRGTAQHDEQCDEFLIPKAQRYRAGQEHRRKAHGLDERRRQRGAKLLMAFVPSNDAPMDSSDSGVVSDAMLLMVLVAICGSVNGNSA